jgi:hypothetical protein
MPTSRRRNIFLATRSEGCYRSVAQALQRSETTFVARWPTTSSPRNTDGEHAACQLETNIVCGSKFPGRSDRHAHRCQIENVPALTLEEAIIGRLKDLSNDRELVQQIAQDSASESTKKTEHTRSLMRAKEQERRKLNQKIKNIYDAVEDETDKTVRAELVVRLKSVNQELVVVENAISELAMDLEASENVVDVSEAMKFLREFREGAFDSMSLAKQAEFLKCRIRKIIVKDGGVYVEVFGRKPERLLQVVGGESKILGIKKPDDPSGSTRLSVLTVFKLVGVTGFEPATSCSRSKRATRLRYTPTFGAWMNGHL